MNIRIPAGIMVFAVVAAVALWVVFSPPSFKWEVDVLSSQGQVTHLVVPGVRYPVRPYGSGFEIRNGNASVIYPRDTQFSLKRVKIAK